MEELKLTQSEAGDSGSQVRELTKSLRIAKEGRNKSETELIEIKSTLSTRTQNFLKEKTDIRRALEKALADLKAADSSQKGSEVEHGKLRSEILQLTQKLTESESEVTELKE